jgi:hypothetical protein
LSTHILVVDDEPDVESMFRQHFRVIFDRGGSSWNSRRPSPTRR